jgi:4-amino-4-deoxy-L-arabinose transferase-like glycosyltransferase
MTTANPEPAAGAVSGSARHRLSLGMVLLLVGLYAAAIYLPFLGSSRTLTRHEADVAQCAEYMLHHDQWLVPHYEGHPWVHKPPLVTWLTVPVFALAGGFSEFAARLPAALSAIGLCMLMAGLAWRFYDPTTGLFAGLIQATMVYTYTQGRLAERDIELVLLLAAAQGVLAWHWRSGRMDLPLKPAVLFHVLVGLAILTKGPPAIALPGMTVIAYAVVRRSLKPLRAVLFTPAIVCSLVIGLWWYVAMIFLVGEHALQRWNYSWVQRFMGGFHTGREPLPFYLYMIPWLVLPWTIALIIGARRLIRKVRQPNQYLERFLWCWFFGGLVFLTLSVFKHQHYAFPILPPLTLLCAQLLRAHLEVKGRAARNFYIAVFAIALVAYDIVGGVVMPWRDHRQATVDFVRQEIPQIPADQPLYVVGLVQAAVYPYLDARHQCIYLRDQQEAKQMLAERAGETIWFLTYRKHLDQVRELGLDFQEVAHEPVHKRHPAPDTLVLGRLRAAAPAASSQQS